MASSLFDACASHASSAKLSTKIPRGRKQKLLKKLLGITPKPKAVRKRERRSKKKEKRDKKGTSQLHTQVSSSESTVYSDSEADAGSSFSLSQ